MSDRRRRKLNDEGEEDASTTTGTSTNPARGERPSECESEEESGDVDLSESESAADEGTEKEEETEEGSDTETEEESYTEDASDSGTETEGADDYSDEEGLDGERQSGDGQEQPEDDKPDDDEDKKNPAYVPRKGAFYEHDFRDGIDDGEVKEEPIDEKKIKKLWQDEGKWSHDCYREDLQTPKSREEIIALYGYDIRAADKPPEAPPMKPGRGRGHRRREPKIKDFMPRMAVIDTTEYGADTVPSLDEDGLITYQSMKSGRGRGNGYNRGGNKSNRNRVNEGYSMKTPRDVTSANPSQDSRNFSDYPSLDESRGMKSNRNYNKDSGGYNRNRDFPHNENQTNEEHDQTNNYSYDRSRKSTGSGRFSNNSNDSNNYSRRGDRYNSNYQQRNNDGRNRSSGDGGINHSNYDDDRNYNHQNDRRDNYRQMDSNWRRAEPPGGDEYRDNKPTNYQGQRGGGYGGKSGGGFVKGGKPRSYGGGEAEDYRHHHHNVQREITTRDDKHAAGGRNNRGYDNIPPRHQQQNVVDTREFTSSKSSTSVKQPSYSPDDRVLPPRQSRPANDSMPTNQGPASSGDVRAITGAGVSGGGGGSSNNVVISNKENVQTINVTITSTTTEKKSYAKERRAKGTTPKAGESQQGPPVVMGGPAEVKDGIGNPAKHYPPPPVSASRDVSSLPMAPGTKRYSSQRQQQQTVHKGGYKSEKPPGLAVEQGAKLYNPALPPPSFFQHDSATSGNAAPSGPQDPQQRFNPTMLPPGNPALSFGLPVPTPGLPIPAPTGSPNVFQGPSVSMGGPTAAGPALIGPPFIAPGMIYGTSPTPNPRVPPPATPVGFPIPLAYTAGHPPPPTQPPANVVPPPVSQGAPSSGPGGQQVSNQPKKVYRGDITYYAPELQQPSRTTQKRPKSAIPIVDPQEILQGKQMEKMQEQQESDGNRAAQVHQPSSISQNQAPQPPPEGSTSTTVGAVHKSDRHEVKEENATKSKSGSWNDRSGDNGVIASSERKTEATKQNDSVVTRKTIENTSVDSNSVNNSSSSDGSHDSSKPVGCVVSGSNPSPSSDNTKVVKDSHPNQSDVSSSSVDTVQAQQNPDKDIVKEQITKAKVSSSQPDSTPKDLPAAVDSSGDANKVVKKELDGVAELVSSPTVKEDSNDAKS